jgi:hypothetical protein
MENRRKQRFIRTLLKKETVMSDLTKEHIGLRIGFILWIRILLIGYLLVCGPSLLWIIV